MSSLFQLKSPFEPRGDQPQAIDELTANLRAGVENQVLLGATGTGKTFTMAQVVARCGCPALVMAPNKTLAAQLYNEFKGLFPDNAVEYFVSYYDYYQPEAYLPRTDTYIEKDSSINDDIDKLRHAATHSLLTRRDVLIVASVSCIYGLGSRDYYEKMVLPLAAGEEISMDRVLSRLVEIQYERNEIDFHRGTFRVRGDVVEVIPAYSRDTALRLEFFGDELEAVLETDPLTGDILGSLRRTIIFPASHYVSDRDNLHRAAADIREELRLRLAEFQAANRLVEAQRLEQRTLQDLEMIEELGYCTGIENYSRHLDGRAAGQPPYTLLDYFPEDFITFIDESHITVPQIGGMYSGDRSRKQTLVDYGFRLPSALDNRPLDFGEFLSRVGRMVFVSATPGPWEIERSQGLVVEQIIRPTGLVDPVVEVRRTRGQVDDLLAECRARMAADERVLVTTLTKRMAEDLTDYLNAMGVSARYLHSDID
ncbi:MAG: excinuclease ABC subunit UvrB, partial [Desulfovibrio sp.]|nr:excinuclease ABC subunit UvrB [Desulfovibrio sp.]